MDIWHSAWTKNEGIDRVQNLFREAFDAEPDGVWAAPGRVNLIGEHTDYNGGLCMPIALDHRTFVAFRGRDDDTASMITGIDGETRWQGKVSDIVPGVQPDWVAYCGGVAWAISQEGLHVPGFDIAIVSCVPLGAGLSSSASVECAVGLALGQAVGIDFESDDASRAHLAQLCVRAENEVAGAPTGGLDQAASMRATEDHAILIDFRDESVEHVPFPLDENGLALIVIDTKTTHSLGDGKYGKRRSECQEVANLLNIADLRELADSTKPEDLEVVLESLPSERLQRRARHVVTEIWRVRAFHDALTSGDLAEAGRLMNDSHDSLRDDYEVSAPELDMVVGPARAAGALGARMTGGGFGGSAIALAPAEKVDEIAEAILAAAQDAGHPTPDFYLVTAGAPGQRLV